MWNDTHKPADTYVPSKGDTMIAEFLVFLGVLLQCGMFPMSSSDCQSAKSSKPSVVITADAEIEAP